MATATAVRNNSRKPRTPPPVDDAAAVDIIEVPPVLTPGLTPMRIDPDEVTDPRFTQREPLFFVGERAFTIPLAFPGSVTLTFSYLAARMSVDAAVDYALGAALGDDDYRALRGVPNLTNEQMYWIRDQILARVLGSAGPKASA